MILPFVLGKRDSLKTEKDFWKKLEDSNPMIRGHFNIFRQKYGTISKK